VQLSLDVVLVGIPHSHGVQRLVVGSSEDDGVVLDLPFMLRENPTVQLSNLRSRARADGEKTNYLLGKLESFSITWELK